MQAYTEIVPPTAVTHSVGLSLLSARSNNLAVAKASLLQVFSVSVSSKDADAEANFGTDERINGSMDALTRKDGRAALSFVAEFSMAGIVTSMAKVRLAHSKSGGDALLLSFKDAKMSLVEWDPETHTLSTISIHYYESEELGIDFFAEALSEYPTYITVDHGGRCAALKFGARNLAMLPLRQSGDEMEDDAAAKSKRISPWKSSFVLPLTLLDPSLLHPADVAFLYEYRDPTLGVLSSAKDFAPHLNREYNLSYSVFTLDVEAKARTQLLSVPGLPADLFKIVPLPLPVGGSLLVGANEVVHVDQAGKTHAVGVNDFALQLSSFPMVDQSDLALRLEYCQVTHLNSASGDILLVLNDGRMAVVSFKMDGRLVAGLSVSLIDAAHGGMSFDAFPTTATYVHPNCIFLGSDESDAVLLQVHGSIAASIDTEGLITRNDDDDDLYGDDNAPLMDELAMKNDVETEEELSFTVADTLPAFVAVGEPAFASALSPSNGSTNTLPGELEMALPTTNSKRGRLTFVTKDIRPRATIDAGVGRVTDAWSVSTRGKDASSYLAVNKEIDGHLESTVFSVTAEALEELKKTDFETDVETLNVGSLGQGECVVQVTSTELRCYDKKLGLSQIVSLADEDDPSNDVVHSSFCDPFLLVIKRDATATLYKTDKKGELEAVEGTGDDFVGSRWRSGCLHCAQGSGPNIKPLVYLLGLGGGLYVFDAAKPTAPLYVADSLSLIPFVLAPGRTEKRGAAAASVSELLVADLGDSGETLPHLILRTIDGEIYIYRPFHFPPTGANQLFTKHLKWSKQPHARSAISSSELDVAADRLPKMKLLTDLDGRKGVIVPGLLSSFVILKEASSRPRILPFHPSIQSAVAIEGAASLSVLTYGTEQARRAEFRLQTGFGQTGLYAESVTMDSQLHTVTYHPESDLYVAGLNQQKEFTLPEDDWHSTWAEEDIAFKPTTLQGKLVLIDRKTRRAIDEYQIEQQDEQILNMYVMSLEVSERTREIKSLVVVGTGIFRGEDQGVMGAIYVFDLIDVVPEPGQPETGRKLKLVVREEVRGAVTAIAEIGNDGFIAAAQGQKCIVRGLKEDNTLLPVAFMDMQCYVTLLKTLPGTGLTLMGDAVKGLRFSGFSPEPWKLQLFGKSATKLEVVAGEILPDDGALLALIADGSNNLLVYDYNPEHPGSLKGQRLIKKSSLHLGQRVACMSLLPCVVEQPQDEDTQMDGVATSDSTRYQVLVVLQSGAIALVAPLDEQQYRRLGAMQTHLTNMLDHPAGLNPRAFRAAESEGFGARGVLDGAVLRRWYDLSVQRQNETVSRMGADRWQVKADLELIAGQGLNYI